MTSQPLNTASLFQTSLRRWQAEWRANHGDTAAAASVGRRLIGASASRRQGRRAAGLASTQTTQRQG